MATPVPALSLSTAPESDLSSSGSSLSNSGSSISSQEKTRASQRRQKRAEGLSEGIAKSNPMIKESLKRIKSAASDSSSPSTSTPTSTENTPRKKSRGYYAYPKTVTIGGIEKKIAINAVRNREIVGKILRIPHAIEEPWDIVETDGYLALLAPRRGGEGSEKYNYLRGAIVHLRHRFVVSLSFGTIPEVKADAVYGGDGNPVLVPNPDAPEKASLEMKDRDGNPVAIPVLMKDDKPNLVFVPGREGVLIRVLLVDGKVTVCSRHHLSLEKGHYAGSDRFIEIFRRCNLDPQSLFAKGAKTSNLVFNFMLVDSHLLAGSREIVVDPYLVYIACEPATIGWDRYLQNLSAPDRAAVEYFDSRLPGNDRLPQPDIIASAPVCQINGMMPSIFLGEDAVRLFNQPIITLEDANKLLVNGYRDIDESEYAPVLRDGESIVIYYRVEISAGIYKLNAVHLYSSGCMARRDVQSNSRSPLPDFLKIFGETAGSVNVHVHEYEQPHRDAQIQRILSMLERYPWIRNFPADFDFENDESKAGIPHIDLWKYEPASIDTLLDESNRIRCVLLSFTAMKNWAFQFSVYEDLKGVMEKFDEMRGKIVNVFTGLLKGDQTFIDRMTYPFVWMVMDMLFEMYRNKYASYKSPEGFIASMREGFMSKPTSVGYRASTKLLVEHTSDFEKSLKLIPMYYLYQVYKEINTPEDRVDITL